MITRGALLARGAAPITRTDFETIYYLSGHYYRVYDIGVFRDEKDTVIDIQPARYCPDLAEIRRFLNTKARGRDG